MVSPESTRPSLSRDLCIVEISILCLSVCLSGFRISGEIIKASGRFFNEGGGQTYFVFNCVQYLEQYELIYMQFVGFSRINQVRMALYLSFIFTYAVLI